VGEGLHPALTLVAGEASLYRHPTPSQEPLGAMLSFCVSGMRSVCDLTRFISFSSLRLSIPSCIAMCAKLKPKP